MNMGAIKENINSFFNWLFYQGYSAESLGIVRLYFGIGLIFYHFVQFRTLIKLDPSGASFHYIEKIWYFDLFGVHQYIPWLTFPIFCVLLISTLLFAFGKWTKPAIIATIICIFYLKGCRDSFSGDVHHRYVIPVSILFLFLFSKCGSVWSIDARKKQMEAIPEWEASWPIRTAQILVAMYYFLALTAKHRISGFEWFERGGKIYEMLLKRTFRHGQDDIHLPLAYEFAQHLEVVFIVGILVFLFEFFVPLVLLFRALWVRIVFIMSATTFHISNYLLLGVKFYLFPIHFLFFFDLKDFHKMAVNRLGTLRPQIAMLSILLIVVMGKAYEHYT